MLVQAHLLRAYDAVHLAYALAVHQPLQQYGGTVLCLWQRTRRCSRRLLRKD